MAQRDLIATFLDCKVVENAAPQTRADGAISLSFQHQPLDDRVGIFLDYAKRHGSSAEVSRQDVLRKAGLFLIKIDSQELEPHWSALLDVEQQFQHCVTVFTARQADHNPVAV